LERLRQISEVIREARADLVFLQEVDFECRRSHRIHQARVLRELLDFPFLAEAESWKANYVPYPYWPLRRHFGRMRSGSAVLSRYPIKSHLLETLPKARSASVVHRAFSPFRYYQKIEVEFQKRATVWANVHLEAYDAEARTQQAAILAGRITQERWDGMAGDFNALPALEAERGPFLEPYPDDYRGDQTSKLMELWTTEGWKDVSGDLIASEKWKTFPTPRSDRRLDYIFVREERAKVREARVITEAGGISDHFPIIADLEWS
jgi:endonuclease/exonuclease/phosphatase family metal-dependent hydrolase